MFVDKKTQKERLKICNGCDFYRNFMMLNKPKIKWGARCGDCSCFLQAKTKLSKDFYGKCPQDKW
jgi:hypothetical protein|tara:strand:- start:4908 stop:5102 length:195 start_codon:yes stop_codon:yes gene_type:complete